MLGRLRVLLVYRGTRGVTRRWWILCGPRRILLRSLRCLIVLLRTRSILLGSRLLVVLRWLRNVLMLSGLLSILLLALRILLLRTCLLVLRRSWNVLLTACLLISLGRTLGIVIGRILSRPVHGRQVRSLGFRRIEGSRFRRSYDGRASLVRRCELSPISPRCLLMLRLSRGSSYAAPVFGSHLF